MVDGEFSCVYDDFTIERNKLQQRNEGATKRVKMEQAVTRVDTGIDALHLHPIGAHWTYSAT